MEEELGSASVREQLITAGIEELNAHGVAGFSLRRVLGKSTGCPFDSGS